MRPYALIAALVGTCLCGFATQALATPTPVLQGGTEVATGTSYGANFMHGYDFVSTINQSLTKLGFWDEGSNGLPQAFAVGLWQTTSRVLLASAVIDSSDALDTSVTVANGQWRFETLASPVALLSGTTYTLGWQAGPIDISNADSLFLDYPTLSVHPNVTIANQFRFLSTSSLLFPTGSGARSDRFRGNVNAALEPAGVDVPEPATLLLFGSALAGIAAARYRRHRA